VYIFKKRKNFKIILRWLSGGIMDDASVLLGVSLFGPKFFVMHPLTLVVAISWEKLNLPNSEVLHTFALLPKPEKPGFIPDRVTMGGRVPGK
jgi:hypothetical protein